MAAKHWFSALQSNRVWLSTCTIIASFPDFSRRRDMRKTDIQNIKRRLLNERARVEESLRRNTQYVLSEIDDSTRDAGDLASASHDRGVLYCLQESDSKRLKLINEVLSRIDKDGYGICEECGQEISKARLEAIPWATSCLTCQEQADLRGNLPHDSYHLESVDGIT
jgi:DnaK suppressor protein